MATFPAEIPELHARSAFSFLRGASQPEVMMERAAELGVPAVAVCDRDGVYGAARAHAAAREKGSRAIVGAELTLEDGSVLPVLVETAEGYRNLCRLITRAKLRGTKAAAPVFWKDLPEFAGGLVALTGDEEGPVRQALARDDRAGALAAAQKIAGIFGAGNVFVELQRHLRRGEEYELDCLADLAAAAKLPVVATNGVTQATREERPVLDVFTCIREHTHLDAAGRRLAANDERHLKPAARMARLFADRPQALTNAVELGGRLAFSLANPGYEFPRYPVPEGESMASFLRKVTMAGARSRYGHLSPRHLKQLNHELDLIAKLGFSGYFLIVWDLVNFCTEQNILVQGRGSAANSAVCYSLGITACDPIACNLLFERFLSEGRTSWPDIDLDLPSGGRRESVIQEVYRRYGPHGAAMTANVITYRGRSAMREIGKALHFPPEALDRFSKLFAHGDYPHTMELMEHISQAGIPKNHPRLAAAAQLYQRIYGLPRHLGQHSGGMIICQGALSGIVPLENAAMPGRVVAQWDKDDCADLGIIKVDLLGLGMMACIQETLELCQQRGCPVDLAQIPKDDAPTYDLMCRADTIGVFQIESRAQMATLPRMKPREFYDVVVEVAIIRPGPIQGDMLHPFLARRAGKEPATYFDERLRPVLERTLGVPLFQEQLLKIAMVMADFTGSEAEELRRALSFHRSPERMAKVCEKLRAGMAKNGVAPGIIDDVAKAVQSFAVYGFPESHAISFALLAYASCWLKVHRTAEFFCGLFNNQPMGFYSPATLAQDARARGLKIRPVSVLESGWRCSIDAGGAIRLGLCYVKGMREPEAAGILAERTARPFASLADFQLRTRLGKPVLRQLAKIGALNGLADHRRAAQWEVETTRDPGDLFGWAETGREQQNGEQEHPAAAEPGPLLVPPPPVFPSPPLPLSPMTPGERLFADYSGTGLTTGPHPMKYLREHPALRGTIRSADLAKAPSNRRVTVAGLVICRQRPGTAKGFVFVSLEDETGVANAILTPQVFEKFRLTTTEEPFLMISGRLQRHEGVLHIKATGIKALKCDLLALPASHDFR